MSVTTRDTGAHRRNRAYSISKAARSSKLSLLSTFTVSTSSSGGSNSTITQESYDKTQHKHRRKRHREHRSRRAIQPPKNASVDVFDFLVEEKILSKERLSLLEDGTDVETDHGSSEDEDSIHESKSQPEVELGTSVPFDESDPERYYRSMSDSGISMGSGSSSGSAGVRPRHLPTLIEEPVRRRSSQHTGTELALLDPRWAWSTSSPQPYHEGYIPPPCPPPPPAVRYEIPPYPYPPYTPYGTPPPVMVEEKRGPTITIREPKNPTLKPQCFRSFTKVSTRLILQMQDEIAELEHELNAIDKEADDAANQPDNTSVHLNDARDREIREEEIYEDLHVKLDNYYHALEMMHKVESISAPAVSSDLAKHRSWLDSRILPNPRTRGLLGDDLRKFTDLSRTEMKHPRSFQPQYLAYCCLVNAVVPLLMFKFVTSVLNRFVLLSLAIVAGAVAQDRMRRVIGRDELTCTLVCVCISAFAAVFL